MKFKSFLTAFLLMAAMLIPAGAKAVGYRGFVEGGISLNSGIEDVKKLYGNLSTTHGLQINEHIFAGLGANLQFFKTEKKSIMPVGIFAAGRYEFLKVRNVARPFIGLQVGALVSHPDFPDRKSYIRSVTMGEDGLLTEQTKQTTVKRTSLGVPYFNLQLGCRIRIYKEIGANVALSFAPVFWSHETTTYPGLISETSPSGYVKENKVSFGYGLTVGFDF